MSDCAAIILAAGKGERMKSGLPKVMHTVAGVPMIEHVLRALETVSPGHRIVVIAPDMDDVADAVAPASTVIQTEALGTGHATAAARPLLTGFTGDILILYGDTPLLRPKTVRALCQSRQRSGAEITLLGFRPQNPGSYGRLIVDSSGRVEAIIEARDASPAQREIELCNAGAMVVDGTVLFSLLEKVGKRNAKGEYYLTDIVELGREEGFTCGVVEADDPLEAMGVNTRRDLAEAESVMQERLRKGAMEEGATLIDPATVWLSADTVIGVDVTFGPAVFIGPGVTIGDRVQIRSFSHIEGSDLEADTIIGPFARLRPGTKLKTGSRIGNFVEVKAALIGEDAKVNHLSYIGDAQIGARTNIGAGTITCNYDGIAKHETRVGKDAFVGSNTALVAPVKIGDGAIVGAGSVITSDVGRETLAVARSRQRNLERRATAFRRAGKSGENGNDR